MLNHKKVFAIIPVRGGSKGVPRKNLYQIGNETLLERAIKLALGCSYIEKVIVSTDDEEMFQIAKQYGVNSPTLRPSCLATDVTQTVDVVLYLINELSIDDAYILLLQVTAPLRTKEDLMNLFSTFEKQLYAAEAIVSLCEIVEPHPDKVQKIAGGYVKSYLEVNPMVPRQSLPVVYKLNGAFYLTHTNVIQQKKTFLPERTIPFIMPKERSVNLDTVFDMYLLEALIEKGNVVDIDAD